MKYKFLTFLLIVIDFHFLNAQNINICFQAGYGFYDMSTFSEINKTVLKQLPFEANIVSNYPAYRYYQPMIKTNKGLYDLGILYLFQTTGSRISSKDYSGEYRFDAKINGHCLGFDINRILFKSEHLQIGIYAQTGIIFSVLKTNEYLQLENESNQDKNKFTSISCYGKFGSNLTIPVNSFFIELNAGYFNEFLWSDYSLNTNKDYKILVKKDIFENDVWDGYRIGLTLGYKLDHKND